MHSLPGEAIITYMICAVIFSGYFPDGILPSGLVLNEPIFCSSTVFLSPKFPWEHLVELIVIPYTSTKLFPCTVNYIQLQNIFSGLV